MKLPPLEVVTVVTSPFEENTYIALREGGGDCVVVDPGMEPEKIIREIEQRKCSPAAILITHGHCDHIAGTEALKQRWPEAPIITSPGEAPKLTDARLNLSAPFGLPWSGPPADKLVDEGDRLTIAGMDFEVRSIPGHAIGHVVYVCTTPQPAVVFVGDVIFAGSVGRTDFPDGDFDQLLRGIRAKLYTLPNDTILLSGHGPATTVGRERRTNPFAAEA